MKLPIVTSNRRRLLAVVLAASATLTLSAPLAAQASIQTASEMSGFEEYTDHEEMWDYLEALQASSTEMKLGVYGETWQGRQLPYAIFSRPLITQPWEAAELGRPVLVFAANVHGGERTFREGLLPLMRDFATPGTGPNALLDQVVIIVTPQINPDGFEADPRATRGNARGIDLNRDYVKLEHPEIQGYVGNVIAQWRPHLYIDGHNGGSRPYNLNYQCPSHAAPDQRITELCDDLIFPAIDARLEADGLESWYYTGGNEEEWRVGGDQARIGRNYGGFVNSVGILFEAPSQALETGARAGYLGYLAVAEWSAENADLLMETVDRARTETIQMGLRAEGEIPVRVTYEAEPEPATWKIVQGEGDEQEVITVTGGRLMKRPVATLTRARPFAYVLPREAVDAVEMLRRHDITVEVLREETSLNVDAYTLAGITYDRQYDHDAVTIVEVGEVVSTQRDFPAGSFVVPTGQMLGRLVSHMLEPETDDNVIYWNTMDAWLPKSRLDEPPGGGGGGRGGGRGGQAGPPLIPIYKVMTPQPIPTRILGNE